MITSKKKLLITGLAIFTLALFAVYFWYGAEIAEAAKAPPVKSPGGAGTAGSIGGALARGFSSLTGTAATILAIVTIVRMFGAWLVMAAAGALDFAFSWNMQNILNNELTKLLLYPFWGYMRDIVNAFLILILLWIAFGIIFNLERINTKRLFVRVVLVGLLVNFSFAMTTTIFGLANALSQPFAKEIQKADPAAKILEITNLHTTLQAAGVQARDLQNIYNQQRTVQEQTELFQNLPAGGGVQNNSGPDRVAINKLPQKTDGPGTKIPSVEEAQGAAFVPIVIAIAKFVGPAIAGWAIWEAFPFFAEKFTGGKEDSAFDGPIDFVINVFAGALFLIIGAFVMFAMAILFMARGIVIMFLAILSPLAFLAAVIPGQDKYWKLWLSKLLSWSFFAPVAFFLLLFSFKLGDLVQANTVPLVKGVELQANLPLIFQYGLFMGLMIGSLVVAKMMGIRLAGTLMNLGQKYAWAAVGKKGLGGFAMGAARNIALPRLGGWAGALERRAGEIKSPYLRAAMGFPSTILRQTAGLGRGAIYEAQKAAGKGTDAEIQRRIAQRAYLPGDIAAETADIMELAKRRKLKALPEVEGAAEELKSSMREAVDRLHRIGDEKAAMDILTARPDIAVKDDFRLSPENIASIKETARRKVGLRDLNEDQMAQWHVWSKMEGRDTEKLDTSVLDDPVQMKMFIANAKGEQYNQLGRIDKKAIDKVNAALDTEEGRGLIIPNMDTPTYRYSSNNAAGEIGLHLPAEHEKPAEIQRLETLRKEVENARNAVRDAERSIQKTERSLEQSRRRLDQLSTSERDLLAQAEDLSRIPDSERQTLKIRNVDIPQIRREIERINQAMPGLEQEKIASAGELENKRNDLIEAKRKVERT